MAADYKNFQFNRKWHDVTVGLVGAGCFQLKGCFFNIYVDQRTEPSIRPIFEEFLVYTILYSKNSVQILYSDLLYKMGPCTSWTNCRCHDLTVFYKEKNWNRAGKLSVRFGFNFRMLIRQSDFSHVDFTLVKFNNQIRW